MSDGLTLGRREVLSGSFALASLGTASVLLTGCSTGAEEPVSLAGDPARLDSLASELDLIAAYERVIRDRPDLAEPLTALMDQHREHAEQLSLGEPIVVTERNAPAVVDVAALQELERQAAGLRAGACVRAGNPELAGLLCLIGASEAQHVVALAGLS